MYNIHNETERLTPVTDALNKSTSHTVPNRHTFILEFILTRVGTF